MKCFLLFNFYLVFHKSRFLISLINMPTQCWLDDLYSVQVQIFTRCCTFFVVNHLVELLLRPDCEFDSDFL